MLGDIKTSWSDLISAVHKEMTAHDFVASGGTWSKQKHQSRESKNENLL